VKSASLCQQYKEADQSNYTQYMKVWLELNLGTKSTTPNILAIFINGEFLGKNNNAQEFLEILPGSSLDFYESSWAKKMLFLPRNWPLTYIPLSHFG
jgi:hypothetical protein